MTKEKALKASQLLYKIEMIEDYKMSVARVLLDYDDVDLDDTAAKINNIITSLVKKYEAELEEL